MPKNVTKKKPGLHLDSENRLRRTLARTSGGRLLVRLEEGYSGSPRTALSLEPSHAVRLASRLLAAAERAVDQRSDATASLFGQD